MERDGGQERTRKGGSSRDRLSELPHSANETHSDRTRPPMSHHHHQTNLQKHDSYIIVLMIFMQLIIKELTCCVSLETAVQVEHGDAKS